MPDNTTGNSIDALLPADIARKAELLGAQKTHLPAIKLLTLAILGGAFIALGAMFATTVLAGANGTIPFGVARLIAGMVFSLGLILIVLGGAELFTGNALMIMALASRKVGIVALARAWGIVYLGNFIGAVGMAVLVYLAGQYHLGDGAVGRTALVIAHDKMALGFAEAFFRGILCNLLVCLAVWLALGAHSTTDKVLAVIFPVSAFVVAGFEHSVANMYLVPFGMLIEASMLVEASGNAQSWLPPDTAPILLLDFFLGLIPVTLGNIVGGGFLVGGIYWFVYLRDGPDR
ncbi:MAG: formate/nitrite transporter family protein [Rhizobiales bacterium]|nr:formate/nitrite transporter family protein [Hyphomicrobiales bacterium]